MGGPLTQAECDAGLEMLVLAGLPRASTGGQGSAVRALYLDLLREAGVTGQMLKNACRRLIMQATPPGKTKYFPDPGQLAALCADDIEDRKRELAALSSALAMIDAPPPAEERDERSETVKNQIHDLAEKMRAKSQDFRVIKDDDQRQKMPSTSRKHTDAAELKAALAKKTGAAA